ncbi:hypothetical protein Csa_017767 [Cucumis sativus]|uniref:Uncharacterized protein n=1 Tax=Cucumis sativus TaxID=3659 RepID=A0A0A0LW00_CUCSA|nr:hypothetical protein Csa_017767 [Cucumis sativus]
MATSNNVASFQVMPAPCRLSFKPMYTTTLVIPYCRRVDQKLVKHFFRRSDLTSKLAYCRCVDFVDESCVSQTFMPPTFCSDLRHANHIAGTNVPFCISVAFTDT